MIIKGGTAQIKGIADYAKEALQLSAKVGHGEGFGGVRARIDPAPGLDVTGSPLSQ